MVDFIFFFLLGQMLQFFQNKSINHDDDQPPSHDQPSDDQPSHNQPPSPPSFNYLSLIFKNYKLVNER